MIAGLALLPSGSARVAAHASVHRRAATLHTVAAPAKPKAAAVAKPQIPTAADVYNRSLTAEALYSYKGHQVTTYWRTGRTIRVLIQHMRPNWRKIEYLAPDSLRGDILISNGREEWRYDAEHNTLYRHVVAAEKPLESDIPVKYEQLRANYILSFLPTTQIYAERKTFVLSITRKNNRTLARRLWIDANTGLVLKREAYSETGKLNVTVAFSDIDYHPHLTLASFNRPAAPPDRTAGSKIRDAHEMDRAEQPVPVTQTTVQLDGKAYAPKSIDEFRLTSAAIVNRAGKKPVLHLRYTDGLVLVSVFEQLRTHTARPTRVPATMMPVQIGVTPGHITRHASLVTLNWDTPALNVTMLGEMSRDRMIDLAKQFGQTDVAGAPK